MSSTSVSNKKSIQYPSSIVKRAERAISCSPFKLALFATMRNQSVSLGNISGQTGIDRGYAKKILSEPKVESELTWLIQVGLLRREVDGQGITDSFRLTPLGRQLVEKWEAKGGYFPTPSQWELLFNNLQKTTSIFLSSIA